MLRAATAYFATVFAVGFLLGVVRTLWLAPRLGDIAAVALELPLMLAASWLACRALLSRLLPDAAMPQRLAMGGLAFAMLMVVEVTLSALAFGRPPAAFLESLATEAGALGLFGQVLFGLMPLVPRRAKHV